MLNNPFFYNLPHQKAKLDNFNLILDAAQKGIDLLNKNIDYPLLLAYRNYVLSVLDIVSKNNINYINFYNQFNNFVNNQTPYQQVQQTVRFLIDIARQM